MESRQQRIRGFLALVSYLLTTSTPTGGFEIRLAGFGATRCSGRVEIFYADLWGTVCDDSWDIRDAKVVCRQLGCGGVQRATKSAHFGLGTGPIWLGEVRCSGHETSLNDCMTKRFGEHDCKHSNDAGVMCASIRLTGSTRCSGRVEVFHEDTWGTICDDRWDLGDAMVVCRQLGCGTARGAAHEALFGQGDKVIWLDEVSCSGNENAITECRHSGFGVHDCSGNEDAGVVCSDSLPKPSISIDLIPVYWGQDVSITCSDSAVLSGGTFFLSKIYQDYATHILTSSSGKFTFPNVGFDDDGSYLCHYEKTLANQTFSTSLSDPITLSVYGLFPPPDISMHPTGNVILGQDVNITCATKTHIKQLGGHFILMKSSQSVLLQEISTSPNSTTFTIDKVTIDDEGRYQCVYQFKTSVSPRSAMLSLVTAPSSVTSPSASVLTLRIYAAILLPLLLLLLLVTVVVILLVYRRKKRKSTQSVSVTSKREDKDHSYVNLHQRSVDKQLRQSHGGEEEKETGVYEQPDEEEEEEEDHHYDEVGQHKMLTNVCVGTENNRKDEREEEKPYIL